MSAPSSCDVAQSSGTTAGRLHTPVDHELLRELPQCPTPSPGGSNGEEEALESHEVIELQTFSDRKAWIEEKIKFLEKMPPIEAFMGLDAIRRSSESIPGLPSRDELEGWIVEHDIIEKQTEIFDTGELMKLRQLTKAATQRNLSPADTDLIELALTTIYDLDKLLHLLRDRSENLDLLGIRLSWEENRIAAWADRRKIIEDLQTFLNSRARWSPLVYETLNPVDEAHGLKRRSSVTSLASVNSDASVNSPGFSRSTRFKLAELLSRDAAQFAGRVTSLRHGKITTAGKCLDHLIEQSRKPVPEEFLDEQDKLEEKGVTNMENLGKFVMNIVMQWRKADEIYVETVKDKATAQNLLEEIETANFHSPTSRQTTSFVSRADALAKRLALRGNPASLKSTFLCPEHPLFEDQSESNKLIVESLASEIASTTTIILDAEEAARTYRTRFEALRLAENSISTAEGLCNIFQSIISSLRDGVPTSDGDGSPPDLMSEACLEASRHSMFLVVLPSLLQECAQARESSGQVIQDSWSIIANLPQLGIDQNFIENVRSTIKELLSLRAKAQEACDNMNARCTLLKEAREVKEVIDNERKAFNDLGHRIADMAKTQKWQSKSRLNEEPLTPKTPPTTPFLAKPTYSEIVEEIARLNIQLNESIHRPLGRICESLGNPLKARLLQELAEISGLLDSVTRLAELLCSIQMQSQAMEAVQSEYSATVQAIEDLRFRLTSCADEVLSGQLVNDDIPHIELDLETSFKSVQLQVANFVDSLSGRIPFVSQHAGVRANPRMNRFVDIKEPILDDSLDLSALDGIVRADSNFFVIKVNGRLESLNMKLAYFKLARIANEIDALFPLTNAEIDRVGKDLMRHKAVFSDIMSRSEDCTDHLRVLVNDIRRSAQDGHVRIGLSFQPIREILRKMVSNPVVNGDPASNAVYNMRRRAVNDLDTRYRSWEDDLSSLLDVILQQQKLQEIRLEKDCIVDQERQWEQSCSTENARFYIEVMESEQLEGLGQKAPAKVSLASPGSCLRSVEEERSELQFEDPEFKKRNLTERDWKRNEEVERACQVQLETERRSGLVKKQQSNGHVSQPCARNGYEDGKVQVKLSLTETPTENSETMAGAKIIWQEASAAVRERVSQQLTGGNGEPEQAKYTREHVSAPAGRIHASNAKTSEEADIFGSQDVAKKPKRSNDMHNGLKAQIFTLRQRLRSVDINETARPKKPSANLPRMNELKRMEKEFKSILSDVSSLPSSVSDSSIDAELQSFKSEIRDSRELMNRIKRLAHLAEDIQKCDSALSDLLEHIDSYPASPKGHLSSAHARPDIPPEEQLAARLQFNQSAIENTLSLFSVVSDDFRAASERARLLQTWSELEEMGLDKLGGKKSRPTSSISSRQSSGRNSSASMDGHLLRKMGGYSKLSITSTSASGELLKPEHPTSRRVVSGGSVQTPSRPPSQVSRQSNRAVSGPFGNSVYGSTFASRQRTSSLSTPHSTPVIHPSAHRAQIGQRSRVTSPTGFEVSTRSVRTSARVSTSTSTWSRAPRNSLSSIAPLLKRSTPPKKRPEARKVYIADPKNKLDVAIGDVVNNLPVGINIEGVSETWKDQSGKYWIGNQDPKLCFCRILRSQTVMVRVGGGWSELSRFIKDHFADSFRLLPDSSLHSGAVEEKWISSATLLEPAAEVDSPPAPPRTPEPTLPFVPTFSLSTPNGRSPHSMKSASNSPSTKGSPLTPLQFTRRVDVDAILRPATPSKSSSQRPRNTITQFNSPPRTSVWRP